MKKHIVTMTEEQRRILQEILSRGTAVAGRLTHAQILLKVDAMVGWSGLERHDPRGRTRSQMTYHQDIRHEDPLS